MKKNNFSQIYLRTQGINFINYQIEHKHFQNLTKKEDLDFILKELNENIGLCQGITLRQSLALWVTQKKKINLTDKNLDYIVNVRQDLSLWNPEIDHEYSDFKKKAIIRYLKDIVYLQTPQLIQLDSKSSKKNPSYIYNSENYLFIKEEFDLNNINPQAKICPDIIGGAVGCFNFSQMAKLFAGFLANDPYRIVLVNSHNHIGMIWLNQKDQKGITIFDPNDSAGRSLVYSTEEAAYFICTQFPDLNTQSFNPIQIIVLKDPEIEKNTECLSLTEVIKICDGDIPDISPALNGFSNNIWNMLFYVSKFTGFPRNQYYHYFHDQSKKKNSLIVANTFWLPWILNTLVNNDSSFSYADMDCSLRDHHGRTLLIQSVLTENKSLFDFVIEKIKASHIDTQDELGRTALIYSVYRSWDFFDKLIRFKASYNLKDNDGNSALDYAIIKRNQNAIDRIVVYEFGSITPLFKWIKTKRMENDNNFSEFLSDNVFLDIIDEIPHDEKKLYNYQTPGGKNLLMLSIIVENFYVFSYLLCRVIDKNITDETGRTALSYAAETKNSKFFYHLLKIGANPYIQDNYQLDALDYLFLEKNKKIFPDIIRNTYGISPIHGWIEKTSNYDIFKQLPKEYKEFFNDKIYNWTMLLTTAMDMKDYLMFKYILENFVCSEAINICHYQSTIYPTIYHSLRNRDKRFFQDLVYLNCHSNLEDHSFIQKMDFLPHILFRNIIINLTFYRWGNSPIKNWAKSIPSLAKLELNDENYLEPRFNGGATTLIYTIKTSNYLMFRYLISKNEKIINLVDNNGRHALSHAAENPNFNFLIYLAELDSQFYLTDLQNNDFLDYLIKSNNQEKLIKSNFIKELLTIIFNEKFSEKICRKLLSMDAKSLLYDFTDHTQKLIQRSPELNEKIKTILDIGKEFYGLEFLENVVYYIAKKVHRLDLDFYLPNLEDDEKIYFLHLVANKDPDLIYFKYLVQNQFNPFKKIIICHESKPHVVGSIKASCDAFDHFNERGLTSSAMDYLRIYSKIYHREQDEDEDNLYNNDFMTLTKQFSHQDGKSLLMCLIEDFDYKTYIYALTILNNLDDGYDFDTHFSDDTWISDIEICLDIEDNFKKNIFHHAIIANNKNFFDLLLQIIFPKLNQLPGSAFYHKKIVNILDTILSEDKSFSGPIFSYLARSKDNNVLKILKEIVNQNKIEILKILLSNGLSANQILDSIPVLVMAIKNNSQSMVDILLEANANPFLTSKTTLMNAFDISEQFAPHFLNKLANIFYPKTISLKKINEFKRCYYSDAVKKHADAPFYRSDDELLLMSLIRHWKDWNYLKVRTCEKTWNLEDLESLESYIKTEKNIPIDSEEFTKWHEFNNLLRFGALVNAQNQQGQTALMLAAKQGRSEIIELLLETKAQFDLCDSTGKNALDYAKLSLNIASIKLLSRQRFNKTLDIDPIRQTAGNCKTIAINMLDHYYAAKFGYSAISLHKKYPGSALISLRQIVKQHGSKQGELLEIAQITQILNTIGYSAEIISYASLIELKDHIIKSLEDDHPLMAFFAVDTTYHAYGFPTQKNNGVNEHASLIVGFNAETDYVTLMHYSGYYRCSLRDLFNSNASLDTQREQEFYLRIKPNPRKYKLLTGDELKQASVQSLIQSIQPLPGTGFRNKFIKINNWSPGSEMSWKRQKLLLDQVNFDYLVKKISLLYPAHKKVISTAGMLYKQSMLAVLKEFLSHLDKDQLTQKMDLTTQNYLDTLSEDKLDDHQLNKIHDILKNAHQEIITYLNPKFQTKSKTELELNLFVVEEATKIQNKSYFLDEHTINYTENMIEQYSYVYRVFSAENKESMRFKEFTSGILATHLEMGQQQDKLHIVFQNIPESFLSNMEFNKLLNMIVDADWSYEFEEMTDRVQKKIEKLLQKIRSKPFELAVKFNSAINHLTNMTQEVKTLSLPPVPDPEKKLIVETALIRPENSLNILSDTFLYCLIIEHMENSLLRARLQMINLSKQFYFAIQVYYTLEILLDRGIMQLSTLLWQNLTQLIPSSRPEIILKGDHLPMFRTLLHAGGFEKFSKPALSHANGIPFNVSLTEITPFTSNWMPGFCPEDKHFLRRPLSVTDGFPKWSQEKVSSMISELSSHLSDNPNEKYINFLSIFNDAVTRYSQSKFEKAFKKFKYLSDNYYMPAYLYTAKMLKEGLGCDINEYMAEIHYQMVENLLDELKYRAVKNSCPQSQLCLILYHDFNQNDDSTIQTWRSELKEKKYISLDHFFKICPVSAADETSIPMDIDQFVYISNHGRETISTAKIHAILQDQKPFQRKPILIRRGNKFSVCKQTQEAELKLASVLDTSQLNDIKSQDIPELPMKITNHELIECLSFLEQRQKYILNYKSLHPNDNWGANEEKSLDDLINLIKLRHEEIKKSNNLDLRNQKKRKRNSLATNTVLDFKSESQTLDRSPQNILLIPSCRVIATLADGNCAFASILGEWNFSTHNLTCFDVDQKRQALCRAITDDKPDDKMKELIQKGIFELLMSGMNLGSDAKNFALLKKEYEEFLNQKSSLNITLWQKFSSMLIQHADIMKYIEERHTLPPGKPLKDKFYNVLNQEDNTLLALIYSVKDLNDEFTQYRTLTGFNLDWNTLITTDIKKEYAQFISSDRTWLLPSELAIVAHIFKVLVIYHPAPNTPPMLFETPNWESIVEIEFNGTNHFQRLRWCYDTVEILPMNMIPTNLFSDSKLVSAEPSTLENKTSPIKLSATLFELADSYYQNGLHELALQIYLRLPCHEHPPSLFNVAQIYKLKGEIDKARTYIHLAFANFKWFDTEHKNNSVDGHYHAGLYQEYVEFNLSKAAEYYLIASAQKHGLAQQRLGLLYEYGLGNLKQDKEQAFSLYIASAYNRCNSALFNIGRCYSFGIGVKKNEKQAVKFYRLSATQNNLNGIVNLGLCYLNGISVKQNFAKSVMYFLKVATMGNPEAQFWLALCYQLGKGVNKDVKKACEWYIKAAAQGLKNAENKLLELQNQEMKNQLEKMSTPRLNNPLQLIKPFFSSTEMKQQEQPISISTVLDPFTNKPQPGDRVSFVFLLGSKIGYTFNSENPEFLRIHNEKEVIKLNIIQSHFIPGEKECDEAIGYFWTWRYYEAWVLLSKAMDKHYPPAFLYAGIMIANGFNKQAVTEIGRKNFYKSYFLIVKGCHDWFLKQAQDKSNRKSLFHMGLYLEYLELNYPQAIQYYNEAKDYPPAINRLGKIYEKGVLNIIEVNRNLAQKCFTMATEMLFADAAYNLFLLTNDYKYCVAAQLQGHLLAYANLVFHFIEIKQTDQAVQWCKEAATLGNAEMQNLLAYHYSEGKQLVGQNHTEEMKWYMESAKMGDAIGQLGLAFCYFYGRGVEKDHRKAAFWFKQAANQGNQIAITIVEKHPNLSTNITGFFNIALPPDHHCHYLSDNEIETMLASPQSIVYAHCPL